MDDSTGDDCSVIMSTFYVLIHDCGMMEAHEYTLACVYTSTLVNQ